MVTLSSVIRHQSVPHSDICLVIPFSICNSFHCVSHYHERRWICTIDPKYPMPLGKHICISGNYFCFGDIHGLSFRFYIATHGKKYWKNVFWTSYRLNGIKTRLETALSLAHMHDFVVVAFFKPRSFIHLTSWVICGKKYFRNVKFSSSMKFEDELVSSLRNVLFIDNAFSVALYACYNLTLSDRRKQN